jgi:hypothetical protein
MKYPFEKFKAENEAEEKRCLELVSEFNYLYLSE